MIPISDDNPTMRFPLVTIALLVAMGAVWVLVQGAGLSPTLLAASVCNLGLVAGEITCTKITQMNSTLTRTRGYSIRYAPSTPEMAPEAPTMGTGDAGSMATWVAAAARPHTK